MAVFSSTEDGSGCGGFMYSPMMSAAFSSNCGSLLAMYRSSRCGCSRACTRMRCTLDLLITRVWDSVVRPRRAGHILLFFLIQRHPQQAGIADMEKPINRGVVQIIVVASRERRHLVDDFQRPL